jgi:hypothetical protein
MPAFVRELLSHRPPRLRGLSLYAALRRPDRDPDELVARFASWMSRPEAMRAASPTLVFAVFGRARATGRLTPELESHLLRGLMTQWALWSTLQLAGIHVITGAARRARRLPTGGASRVAVAC